jgi:hypothetical protein
MSRRPGSGSELSSGIWAHNEEDSDDDSFLNRVDFLATGAPAMNLALWLWEPGELSGERVQLGNRRPFEFEVGV